MLHWLIYELKLLWIYAKKHKSLITSVQILTGLKFLDKCVPEADSTVSFKHLGEGLTLTQVRSRRILQVTSVLLKIEWSTVISNRVTFRTTSVL